MLPDFTIDGMTIAQSIAYGAVVVIAGLAHRSWARIEKDVSMKADKELMEREIEALKADLKDARDARERDTDRLERASAEKFSEFSSAMRDRIGVMERNVEDRVASLREDVGHKLDMILQLIDRRK